MKSIGFAGLGKMGSVMAPLLMEAGYDLCVWNRSPKKTDHLVSLGAKRAATPCDLVTKSEIIVSMLSDDAAVCELFAGPGGFLSTDAKQKLFIDMSTLRPPTVEFIAGAVSKAGGNFIDAPVSGTVAPARLGNLLIMCGASDEDFERAKPVLEVFGRRIVRAGSTGKGTLLKLVVNLPLAVYWGSLAEAISMGNQGGLELELMLETIQDSSAALAVLGLKTPTILGQPSDVAFDVASMKKDLLSMLDTGERAGVPMPTTNAALTSYSAALEGGFGSADAVDIVRFVTHEMTSSK